MSTQMTFLDETLYTDFNKGLRVSYLAHRADVPFDYARSTLIEMVQRHDLRRPQFTKYQNPLNPSHWEKVAQTMLGEFAEDETLQDALADLTDMNVDSTTADANGHLSEKGFELMFIRFTRGSTYLYSMFIDLHTTQSDLNKLLFYKINHYVDTYERTHRTTHRTTRSVLTAKKATAFFRPAKAR